MSATLKKAIREAGAYYDDCTTGPVWVRLRACAMAPSLGSDGDYTEADRRLFRRAADWAEKNPNVRGTNGFVTAR